MLSYQHAYHAGNMADVHKHAVLAVALEYLTAKDKPLTYIETHAGRAIYDLDAPEALKTGEAAQGIDRLAGWFPPEHPYARVIARTRGEHGPRAYPGSPLIASHLLRPDDRMVLAEMHPQEHAALDTALPWARIHFGDGVQMALATCPPTPRRGLCLIDPAYEVKTDYATMAYLVPELARKWNVGVFILWYPILADAPHTPMLRELARALPEAVSHEVRFPPARTGHRMVGSGLFIVRPPFGITKELGRLTDCFAE